MPQFESEFFSPMLFWTIVSFVLLLLLLRKYALPGLMEVLEARRQRIKDDLETAERLRLEAAAVKAEHEAQLKASRAAADEVIARAQEKARALLAENEARMKEEADRIVAEAQRTIAQERAQAVTDLRALAADLAVAAAEKFVATGLDAATQRRLVEESLAELEARYRA
jgi:F-type H+-transporting ATPase subunit b